MLESKYTFIQTLERFYRMNVVIECNYQAIYVILNKVIG